MVRGELDIGQYRAAVYGVSTFINALKAEMPGTLLHGNIAIGPPPGVDAVSDVANMTPTERNARMHEIITKAGYVKADNPPELECVRTVGTIGGEPLQVVLADWIVQGEAMQAACDALAEGDTAEPRKEPADVPTSQLAGNAWRSCGIGARR